MPKVSSAALLVPQLRVVPPDDLPVFTAMARFSDGAAHSERRSEVIAALPAPENVGPVAATLTRAWLCGREGSVDAMELAREVPVTALAQLLGLPPELPPLVRRWCDLLAGDGDPAPIGQRLMRYDTAALSILFQAHDACAAMIGLRLMGSDRPAVTTTRRRAAAEVTLEGAVVAAGEVVTVDLPAAGQFGAGPHACPGPAVAQALVDAVVGAVSEAGWTVAAQAVTFAARTNLNLPERLLLVRS